MIVSTIKYPSISAKLKGMYSKKIKGNDIIDLYKQDNLKSIIAILKNKDQNLKSLDENADRQQIEKLLNLEIIYDIEKIVKYLDKSDKKIFNAIISKYEIECIKRAIRLIYSQNKYDENIQVWTSTVFKNLKGMESVTNMQRLYKIIDNPDYKKILKKYLNDENVQINILELENEFDKLYFNKIYNSINNKDMKKMIGHKIDFSNILWIYRLKEYYKFSEEEIRKFLIKDYYLISKNEIDDIVKSKNISEMNDVLKKTPYKDLIYDNIYDLECATRKYLKQLYTKNFQSRFASISNIYSYFNLIEMHNSDIIGIVEAIRYGVDKEKLLKKLLI